MGKRSKKNSRSNGFAFFFQNVLANKKALMVGTVYLLAGRPVEAILLMQKMQKNKRSKRHRRNASLYPYLEKIINSHYTDWPQFYSKMDKIIKELNDQLSNNEGVLPKKTKENIFWFFRNSGEAIRTLSDESSKMLYQIIKTVIRQDKALLSLHAEDLSILEDILIVLQSVTPQSVKNIRLVEPLIRATIEKNSLIYTKKVGGFISQLFKRVVDNLPDRVTSESEISNLIGNTQQLINTHLVWNKQDPVAMLVHGLTFLKNIREKYKTNPAVCEFIDSYAKDISQKAYDQILAQFFDYPEAFLQEDIGTAYVKYLAPSERERFNGIYKIKTPSDILPHSERKGIRGKGNSPDVAIEINYAHLTPEKKAEAFQMLGQVYKEIEQIKLREGLKSKEAGVVNLKINIFDDKDQFERYGHMVWDVDSSGGGICIAGEDDVTSIAFIYQTEKGFLNFKHEVTHAVMNHFLGKSYTNYVPGTFTEGIADLVDKGRKNINKMRALRQMFTVDPKTQSNLIKKLPEIVGLNEGGTIVYTWGYFWVWYLLEQGPREKVRPLLLAIQSENKEETTRLIKDYGLSEESAFNEWIDGLNKNYQMPSEQPSQPLEANSQYRDDLQKNPEFFRWIQQQGRVKFVFNDTVFVLETQRLTRYRWDGEQREEQAVTLADYDWLKEGLSMYVLGNKIKKQGVEDKENYEKIMKNLLNLDADECEHYRIKAISNEHEQSLLADFRTEIALEAFTLNSPFLALKLKSSYPRVKTINQASFDKIVEQSVAELKRENFLLGKDKVKNDLLADSFSMSTNQQRTTRMVTASVSDIDQTPADRQYLQDLHKTPSFLKAIKHYGSVEFKFGNTIFVLKADRLARYHTEGKEKIDLGVSLYDYAWLKEALSMYAVKNKLKELGQTHEGAYQDIIRKLLNLDEKNYLDRCILEITTPSGHSLLDDPRMKSDVEDFILQDSAFIKKLKNHYPEEKEINSNSFSRILRQEIPALTTVTAEPKDLSTRVYYGTPTPVPKVAQNTSPILVALGVSTVKSMISMAVSSTPRSQDLTTVGRETETNEEDNSNHWRWIIPTVMAALVLLATLSTITILRIRRRRRTLKPEIEMNERSRGESVRDEEGEIVEQLIPSAPPTRYTLTHTTQRVVSQEGNSNDQDGLVHLSSNVSERSSGSSSATPRICITEIGQDFSVEKDIDNLLEILEKRFDFLKKLRGYDRIFGEKIRLLKTKKVQGCEGAIRILDSLKKTLDNEDVKKCQKHGSEIRAATIMIESLEQRFKLLLLSSPALVEVAHEKNYLSLQLIEGVKKSLSSVQTATKSIRTLLEEGNFFARNKLNKPEIKKLFDALIHLETGIYDANLLAHSHGYYKEYELQQVRDCVKSDRRVGIEDLPDSQADLGKFKKTLREDLLATVGFIINSLKLFKDPADFLSMKKDKKLLLNAIDSIETTLRNLKEQIQIYINHENGYQKGLEKGRMLHHETSPLMAKEAEEDNSGYMVMNPVPLSYSTPAAFFRQVGRAKSSTNSSGVRPISPSFHV